MSYSIEAEAGVGVVVVGVVVVVVVAQEVFYVSPDLCMSELRKSGSVCNCIKLSYIQVCVCYYMCNQNLQIIILRTSSISPIRL
jgi:hypothetical protein